MNTIQRGLITLLRSAVTGECLPLPESFSLEAAADIIQKQALSPLIFQGALNCRLPKAAPMMQRLRQEHLREFFLGERQMRAVSGLFTAFEANGIDYLPLKGCAIRSLYPSPELRPMGDADILIRREQYPQIVPLLKDQGYAPGVESDYDYVWQSEALYLELHKSLVSPGKERLYAYFGSGWDRAVKGEGSRHSFTGEDEFVYLFAHMAKHFRKYGIGCRHFLDLYVYRRAYPDLNESRIEEAMAALGLLEFYRNVGKLLLVWFADADTDPVTDAMTDFIFSGGSFGKTENGLLLETMEGETLRSGKLRTLGKLLFPPFEAMQRRYPVLEKLPFLLPLFWLLRWCSAVFFRGRRSAGFLRMTLGATEEKATQRQAFLRLTGLSEE